MGKKNLSRRNFMGQTALGIGAGLFTLPKTITPRPRFERLPREVWVGTVSTAGLRMADAESMVQRVLEIMESFIPYEPDIICLPECFAYSNVRRRYRIGDVAEAGPGPVISAIAAFAKAHQCYVICPTYSRFEEQDYIAAVLIDRKGAVKGEYRKARPAKSEMETGVRPGPLDPPVFETDFGKIGIQICFDIKWSDGWEKLKAAGAEIIFWPSAYAGGQELNARAWRHQLHVVSSTQKDTSKICDVTGQVIAQTNRWQPHWTCAPINLEKTFLLSWPAVKVFPDIQKKYGRRIKLTIFAEEEWTVMESLDPDLKVADVLAEFDLQTRQALLASTEEMQKRYR